jgi:PAS domain S-box-containing protein
VAETTVLGEPSVVIGLTIDIDARKRAELALLESENRLSLAVWGGALGVWSWDIDGDRCAWLNDWCASMDFDPCRSEPHGVSWNDNTHPEDRDRIERIDTDCHISKHDTYEYEYRHRTTRGEWRWLLERGRVASRSNTGRATRITGVCMDITQRKENERKLHQYQERYFAVVQRVPGYVFEMRPSTDGLAALTWASDGLKRVFGCDLETYKQLGGWRRFWFAEDYDRSVENLRKLLRGEPTEQSWRVRNLDGEERWIHAFYTPFLDPSNGKVDVILGVAHDVSERVQLERRVLNAAQQEQQRIASDLHDGLGQELTGIAMMLQSIVPRIQAIAPEEAGELSETIKLVRVAISNTRSIAHGLAPISAIPGALPAALRSLARSARNSKTLTIDVQTLGDRNIVLPVELATQLYRISQEALTNAIRHSGARRIEIALDLSAERSQLTITDDGRGIECDWISPQGLGLRTVAYRAHLIGGTLQILGVEPHGTQITCSFPRLTIDHH